MREPDQYLLQPESDADAIPVLKAELGLGKEILPFLDEIEASGVYSNFGPQVQSMEREFAQFLGLSSEQVVSTGNATLGIQGAIVALNQPTWVLASWTFAATAHASLLASDSIAFGEVSSASWALDPAQVAVESGAIVTAPFGAEITIGAEWNHVGALVVDAAASIASFPIIRAEFRRPWAVAVSLHATKILGIGEGGFVVFSSTESARNFRQWTNFGFWGNRESSFPATNAKMSEMSAAIARLRLANWPVEKSSWLQARSLAHQVADELAINPPFASSTFLSPYWIVKFRSHSEKLAVIKSLDRSQIGYRDWWSKGCHKMPAFRRVRSVDSLEVTEDLARRSLGLPFFRGISSTQVMRVRSAINEARA